MHSTVIVSLRGRRRRRPPTAVLCCGPRPSAAPRPMRMIVFTGAVLQPEIHDSNLDLRRAVGRLDHGSEVDALLQNVWLSLLGAESPPVLARWRDHHACAGERVTAASAPMPSGHVDGPRSRNCVARHGRMVAGTAARTCSAGRTSWGARPTRRRGRRASRTEISIPRRSSSSTIARL